MQPLPPIRSAGTSTRSLSKKRSDVMSPHCVPSSTTSSNERATIASTADSINRNKLRQEARRRVQHITHGVAEQRTYLQMLQHIREQFAHTSQQPLQPLVLPPQWPSTARPREPQTAKFSRGIALYKSLQKRSNAALPACASTVEGDKNARAGAGMSATWAPSCVKAAASATDGTAESTASYMLTELPSTSTNFAREHRWETVSTDDRTFFQRRLLNPAVQNSVTAVADDVEANDTYILGRRLSADLAREADLSPLDDLPTLEEKVAHLSDLEHASRQHVMAYEKWDLQVVSEMMAVRYVTFVLKPCMDGLRIKEAEEREKIGQHEDRLSFYLFHECPLVLAIEEELKIMKAREMQLDRILGVTANPLQRPLQQTGFTNSSNSVSVEDGELGRTQSLLAGCRSSKPPGATTSSTAASGSSVPAPDARRILHQYVRQCHGDAIDAAAANRLPSTATKTWFPSSNPMHLRTSCNDHMRRSSTLMLPPLPSTHAPRRNAVGVADYVALLDECMNLREHIVRNEQQSRNDLNRAFYEEQQVVLEWQRRRMHLERLMYWRQRREDSVQNDVVALTEMRVGAPLDPKVALLLELLEGEEEDARAGICDDECYSWEAELWTKGTELRHRHDRLQVEKEHWTTFDSGVRAEEAVAAQQLLLYDEVSQRHCKEIEASRAMEQELSKGTAMLRVLYEVSISPARCVALDVLQSAFRRSLRGRLGWRATHSAVGREITDARNAKKIMEGKRALQSFKDTLEAEKAQLVKEQESQDIQEQRVLFAGEAADRVALSSEQDFMLQGIRRACVLHVAEVYRPVFERLLAAEAGARVQLEVENELEDEAMRHAHTTLMDIIARKTRLRYDETVVRKALVAEERSMRNHMRTNEVDRREELRLDAEAKEAMRQADRITFSETALQRSRNYDEGALAAYVRLMTEASMEVLGYSAMDSGERRAICAEERKEAALLFSNLSAQACEVLAQTLLRQRQVEFNRVHRQALFAAETEKRADIILTETIDWEALKPALVETVPGPLRDLIARRDAVNAISTWYKAVRSGEIGRAVSRRQLHEDLTYYREERNLRRQQIAQRLHTQKVRDQLDALMHEIYQEEIDAVQKRLDTLVQHEEPRGRDEVEAMQEIVFDIIVRNAEALTAEVRSQLVNTEALLWQHESYERKLLIKASRRLFKGLLERERLQLSEDYFASRIQRTWAAYIARKRHAQVMADKRARLFAFEQQARAAVELEELEEAALDIYKPCYTTVLLHARLQESLSHVYEQLCCAVLAVDKKREWQERADLLWEMRYHLCDSCLCSEEEHARRALAADFHRPFLLEEELLQTEAHERRVLMEERTNFLLRILARAEQAQRQVATAEEAEEMTEVQKESENMRPKDLQELYERM